MVSEISILIQELFQVVIIDRSLNTVSQCELVVVCRHLSRNRKATIKNKVDSGFMLKFLSIILITTSLRKSVRESKEREKP